MVRVAVCGYFWLYDGMAKSLFFIFLLSWFFSACGVSEKKSEPIPKSQDKRLAGRVDQVVGEADYVLIRKYGKWAVLDGEVVISQGAGRTANLLPTGEELGEHVAADIRAGDVQIGDAVYIHKSRVD